MLKNMSKNIILLSVIVILFSGCSTIVKGTKQKVAITSVPSGAYVKVFDKSGALEAFGETPFTAELDRGTGPFQGSDYKIVFDKSGYFSKETKLQSELDWGWSVLGNVPFAVLPGLLFDSSTGAVWNLSDGKVNISMESRNYKN